VGGPLKWISDKGEFDPGADLRYFDRVGGHI